MAKYIPHSELLTTKNYRDQLILNSIYYSFFTTHLTNLTNSIKLSIAEFQQWTPEQGCSAALAEASKLIMIAKSQESSAILEEINNILAQAANMRASV